MLFDPLWAEDLWKETKAFTCPALLKGRLLEPSALEAHLARAFSNIASGRDKALLRVFTNRGQRYDLVENIRALAKPKEAPMFEWMESIVKEEDFYVTLNGLTKWSESLAELLTEEVCAPLLKKMVLPINGLDFYSMSSVRGFTPFGIHKDPDETFIFHLGPGERKCYTWSREVFESLSVNDRSFDFERLIPHAQEYRISPGDILFIPEGVYHVFENSARSTFLGLIVYPTDINNLVSHAIQNLLPSNRLRLPNDSSDSDLLNNIFCALPAPSQIQEVTTDSILLLRSNSFLIHKPELFLGRENPNDFLDDERIRVRSFILHERDKELLLFCRGRKLAFQNHPQLMRLMEGLKSAPPSTIRDIHNMEGLKISREALNLVLKKLVQTGIIQFLEND